MLFQELAPVFTGPLFKVVVGGVVGRVLTPLNKVPVPHGDQSHIVGDASQFLDLGSPSGVVAAACGQVDIKDAKGEGGTTVPSAAGEDHTVGVAAQGGADRIKGGRIVVKEGGADQGDCAAGVVGGVIVEKFPTWEGTLKGSETAEGIEPGLLKQDDMGVFRERQNVEEDTPAASEARLRSWVGRKGGNVVG